MSVGFVMLAHTALERAATVACHLAGFGCPVHIHVDKRTSKKELAVLETMVANEPLITLAPRITCDWGTWSLVSASRAGAMALLETHRHIEHVFLVSGSCLPIKPVPQLISFLEAHRDTDFIESVTIEDVPWTTEGLSEERFTFSFPFKWKTQRPLFDLWVDAQRRMGRRRAIPPGLKAHMGSQWWCLSRRTLNAIMTDPRRREFDRFFKRVWIPDESYFQSMVRLYGQRIESLSLTLSKFDFLGKPHVFYDDHLPLLRQSNAFFARKIWTGADALYEAFLSPNVPAAPLEAPSAATEIDRVFAKALRRRTEGRAGLLAPGRFPKPEFEVTPTAAPYAIFHGFGDVFEAFPKWISTTLGSTAHGRLFAPDRIEFAQDASGFTGGLTSHCALRDYNPQAFLRNLIWNADGQHQSFLYAAGDNAEICKLIANDPNAYVAAISGAWALPLYHSGGDMQTLRIEAARLQKAEAAHLDRLRQRRTRAKVQIWTLAEFLLRPAVPLQTIVDDFSRPGVQHLTRMPRLKPIDGIAEFLQELRNAGMSPYTAGEVPDIQLSSGSSRERLGRGLA